MRCPSRRQKNAFSDYFSQLLAKCPETTWRQPRRTACNRSDWHPEFADASKDRQDLSTIGSRGRPRKPELLDGASGAVGVLRLEGCGDLGGLVAPPAQRQCRHQEQLRASIAAVAFQGFLEQRDGRFGPADEQLGKSAEKEPDAVTAIGAVEPHGPLDRRQCIAGIAAKGRVVPGKTRCSGIRPRAGGSGDSVGPGAGPCSREIEPRNAVLGSRTIGTRSARVRTSTGDGSKLGSCAWVRRV